MAVKELNTRVVLEQLDDTGEDAAAEFDQTLSLTSFTDFTAKRRIKLAAAAADQALAFTNATALFLFSHDNTFSLRLAAGETLLTDLRCFLVQGDVEDEAVASTSVLLTGNGDNETDLEVWIVEKTT